MQEITQQMQQTIDEVRRHVAQGDVTDRAALDWYVSFYGRQFDLTEREQYEVVGELLYGDDPLQARWVGYR